MHKGNTYLIYRYIKISAWRPFFFILLNIYKSNMIGEVLILYPILETITER